MTPGIQRVVEWLRAGYPQGVPDHDYIPLMAILRRRMGDQEVEELGQALVLGGIIPANRIDVGVGITKTIDELPSIEETERVIRHLRAQGWPVDFNRF